MLIALQLGPSLRSQARNWIERSQLSFLFAADCFRFHSAKCSMQLQCAVLRNCLNDAIFSASCGIVSFGPSPSNSRCNISLRINFIHYALSRLPPSRTKHRTCARAQVCHFSALESWRVLADSRPSRPWAQSGSACGVEWNRFLTQSHQSRFSAWKSILKDRALQSSLPSLASFQTWRA